MSTAYEIEAPAAAMQPWWRQRWYAILAGFLLAGIVGVVFAEYVRHQGDWSRGQDWERNLLIFIHRPLPQIVDALMLVCPWFGTNISLIPAVALVVWWLWARRQRADLAMCLAVVQVGSYLLNPSLKGLYDRARPDLFERRGWFGWTSYPSGHAIASISVLITMAIILYRIFGWKWPFCIVIPIILASLYSRMYLGVHWPTDVIGGALVGAVWLAATSYAFRDGEIDARASAP